MVRIFLRLALLLRFKPLIYCFQMTLNNHSVFRKVHHVRVPQLLVRYFLLLHRPPCLPPQQQHRKCQPGRCLKTRMERTNGKALGVHAVTGITRPRSDHRVLGTRSSFLPQRRQRAIRREDVLARMQRPRLHKGLLPVVSRLLSRLPRVPLLLLAPVRLT